MLLGLKDLTVSQRGFANPLGVIGGLLEGHGLSTSDSGLPKSNIDSRRHRTMSSKERSMSQKGKPRSLDNIVESQKKKKSAVGSSSGTSVASGTTSSSSGSKSPSRKSKSTKMMANASAMSKTPTIQEETVSGRVRPRMARRMSDDTFAFDQNDWNDSETEGFSPVNDGTGQVSNGFMLQAPKNPIQPMTRKVTETEQEWFSEWEDMDEESHRAKSNATGNSRVSKGPAMATPSSSSSKKWSLTLEEADGARQTFREGDHSKPEPKKERERKSSVKDRKDDVPSSASQAALKSSRRSKDDEESMNAGRRGKSTGSLHDNAHDTREVETSRRNCQVPTTSLKLPKHSSRDDDTMDVSRSGRKKQALSTSDHDDMDTSRRGSKSRSLSSPNKTRKDDKLDSLESSSKRPSKSTNKVADREAESHRSSRSKAAAHDGDDMDSSRRGGSSSKKSSSKATSGSDDDMDSSRRGASSRKGGKDIVSRRTLRRGTSTDDDVEVHEESPKKEKKESRLASLRRASMAGTSAIDDERNRRGRSSDADTVSSSRRSVSVSRRASVAGDGRVGRDVERRGEEDPVRTRSRSRRSVSRGRAPEKPQPKETSILGDCNESDHDEEDDVERLFRKAHADERKFMLDKSRVGPVRALEPASSDDEDEDDEALMTPRRRKTTGYLPSNLNDTSNVHAHSSSATPRRKEGKKSASRRQSLDDMLFNFGAGPQAHHMSGSASVGYNPSAGGGNFSSSASVPGEMLAKKSSNPADLMKNVDELLDARRRSHAGDSPRSHKGQLHNSGATPAAVVSANYANKMRQLQNTRKFSLGGPQKAGSPSHSGPSSKGTSLVLPLITSTMETRKKTNPLGIRRPTMI